MVVIKHAALLVAGILSLGLAFPDNNDWGNNPGGASHGPPGTGVTGGGMPTGAPGGNGGNAGHGGYGNPQYGGGKGGPGGPGGDEGDKKDGGQFGGKDHAGAGKPGGGQGPGGWVGGNGNPPNGQGNKSGGGQGQGGWSGGNGNPPDDHGAGWDKNGGGQDGGVHPRDDESGSFRGKGGPGKGMTDHASKPPKERVKHPRDDHDGNKKDWKIAPHDTGSGRPRGPLGHIRRDSQQDDVEDKGNDDTDSHHYKDGDVEYKDDESGDGDNSTATEHLRYPREECKLDDTGTGCHPYLGVLECSQKDYKPPCRFVKWEEGKCINRRYRALSNVDWGSWRADKGLVCTMFELENCNVGGGGIKGKDGWIKVPNFRWGDIPSWFDNDILWKNNLGIQAPLSWSCTKE